MNLAEHKQGRDKENESDEEVNVVDGDKDSEVNFIVQKILYTPKKKDESQRNKIYKTK